MPVQYGFAESPSFPVGILIDADVSDSDLAQFYSAMSVNRTGSLVRLGGSYGTGDVDEAALDVETVSALAPATTIYLYRIPSLSGNDIVAGMNSVVQDNAVAVLSMSIGGCENQGGSYDVAIAEDSAAVQASAQGTTVVASSGDSGGPAYLLLVSYGAGCEFVRRCRWRFFSLLGSARLSSDERLRDEPERPGMGVCLGSGRKRLRSAVLSGLLRDRRRRVKQLSDFRNG
jgi:hypothetical protein